MLASSPGFPSFSVPHAENLREPGNEATITSSDMNTQICLRQHADTCIFMNPLPTLYHLCKSYPVYMNEHHEGISLARGVSLSLQVAVDQLWSIRNQILKIPTQEKITKSSNFITYKSMMSIMIIHW